VSRQHEHDYYRYYDYPSYWGYSGVWGMGQSPGLLTAGSWNETVVQQTEAESGDIHLRSARDVRGYHIQGSDDAIGHIADFIVDDETWEIRYLVLDTKNWWFGKKVLVSPLWARRISWEEHKVYIEMSRAEIKNSPEWNPNASVNREYEARLYDYYGRPVYWEGGNPPVEAPTPHQPASAAR
jgi:hypothetical protein